MIKAISMCGHPESLRRLRDAFRADGIDLLNRDYQLEQDVTEELQAQPDIEAVLIVEQITVGLENGKYGLIKAIRAADATVRILFCGGSAIRDAEFENWCYKYTVYDFFYPHNDSYDTALMAECIKQGRYSSDSGARADGAGVAGAKPDNKSGGGFLRNVGFNWFSKKPTPQSEVAYPQANDESQSVAVELINREAIGAARVTDNVPEPVPVPIVAQETAPVPPLEPQIIVKEVIKELVREVPVEREVIREVPVEREVIRYVEKSVTHGTFTIAVFGLTRGAGATTMAHGIAEALHKFGAKTVLVAASSSADLTMVKTRYPVHIAENFTEGVNALGRFAASGYDFMVVDFGALFDISPKGNIADDFLAAKGRMIGEFIRCHLHIGMGFSSPWHVEKLRFFTENEDFSHHLDNGNYVFVLDGDSRRYRGTGLEVMSRAEAAPAVLAATLTGANQNKSRRGFGL